jgi:hypothetical protein
VRSPGDLDACIERLECYASGVIDHDLGRPLVNPDLLVSDSFQTDITARGAAKCRHPKGQLLFLGF